MKYYIVILFYCCLGQQLYAQDPVAWHLTVKDGLPSNEVYEITQDKQGYIWIGTDDGLCKYDGQDFFYYSNSLQKGRAVSHFQEDSEGRLWLQSFEGELLFIENDSLHYFEPIDELGEITFFSYWIGHNGDVWVSDNYNEVYVYSKQEKKWHTIFLDIPLRSSVIRNIQGTEDGIVYILTDFSLMKIEGETLTKMSLEELFQFAPEFLEINKLGQPHTKMMELIYVQKRLILISYHEKLGVFEYKDGAVSYLNRQCVNNGDWYAPTTIQNFSKTAEGQYWALTGKMGGVPIFDLGGLQTVDKNKHLFPDKNLSSLFMDREKNCWVGTLKEGIYMIPNWNMQVLNVNNSFLEEKEVGLSCKIDKENMVVSSDEGKLFHYNTLSKQVKKYQLPKKGEIMALNNSDKRLLCGTHGGIFLFEHDNLEVWNRRIIYDAVQTIKNAFIYKNDYFFVTRGSSGHSFYPLIEELTPPYPNKNWNRTIYPTRIWDATFFPFWKVAKHPVRTRVEHLKWLENNEEQDGVILGTKGQVKVVTETGESTELLGEQGQSIQAMKITVVHDKAIWVNTFDEGIYGFDSSYQLQYHLTTKDGLIDNRIQQIEVDDQNNLWLLSTRGVQYWNLQTQENRIYTMEDGLPTYHAKDIMCFDHKIWLSTEDGLVVFDENLNSLNAVPPNISIKNIAINDKDTLLRMHYDLVYNQNFLAIDVEGLAYKSRGNFQYKYRMLGIDTIWRLQASASNVMRFPQLNSGEYTFEVKTVNEDGVESAEPARMTFSISPPYWETWWYQLLTYGGVFAVVLGIIVSRIQRKRERERQQNHVNVLKMQALQSQMNPHFVFNVLAAVQNLWLQHKNEGALNMQSTFAKLLRKIFNYSSKAAILIEEEQEFLNNYLDLEQIRFEHQVEVHFEVDEDLIEEEDRIPPLLIQPIIENSFKHGLFHKAADKKLWIHLKREAPYLYCLVEDNGVGRSSKKKHKRSSGQNTTQERLDILQENIIKAPHPHNNFKITDLVDQEENPTGTRVEIWIPFV